MQYRSGGTAARLTLCGTDGERTNLEVIIVNTAIPGEGLRKITKYTVMIRDHRSKLKLTTSRIEANIDASERSATSQIK